MALPVILFDSSTGSDSLASGAGPATALTGSAGVSDGTGLIITLDGSPDLTNVATDGSHVLYFADATAGKRNFGKITAKANSGTPTAQVTVADAFALSATKAWAIGGKRLTLTGTNSYKLIENNTAAGDAMPGWVLEMQSGYTETIAQAWTFRRAGDTTSGPIIIRGVSGAGTIPILTWSTNASAINNVNSTGDLQVFQDFEIQNSNATKTASVAFVCNGRTHLKRLKISHSTNKFWKALTPASNAPFTISECEFGYTASDTIVMAGGGSGANIQNCWIHDSGGIGITAPAGNKCEIVGCLIKGCTGDGIKIIVNTASNGVRSFRVSECTIDSNTNGIEITSAITNDSDYLGATIENNICSNNSAYGINFSAASFVQAVLDAYGTRVRNNDLYNNTSGPINPSSLTNENGLTLDPQYTNSGGNDFSIGTNLKAKGYPIGGTLKIGNNSSTYSYKDMGVAQRQEPAGGGVMPTGLFARNIGTY